MSIEYVKDPKWVNAEHTMIDLTIKFKQSLGDFPFTADENDCEAHGRELFARALAGEFGEVLEYVPPPEPEQPEIPPPTPPSGEIPQSVL
jgi:hypothetical protein